MSTVNEIEDALKELPLEKAKAVAEWLQVYLDHQSELVPYPPTATPSNPPDYAARRRLIFGDKTLPNMVLAAREEERW